ncbi:hypothetical protein BGZ65_010174, partial [Modicella reniformis]
SLGFGEYYPQSTTTAAAPAAAERDDDDDDDDDDNGDDDAPFYRGRTIPGAFSALNLSGDGTPALSSSPYEDHHDSDGGHRDVSRKRGHQRWSSVDSNNRYDSDDQQPPSHDHEALKHEEHIGHYRPGSMRSLGSQLFIFYSEYTC